MLLRRGVTRLQVDIADAVHGRHRHQATTALRDDEPGRGRGLSSAQSRRFATIAAVTTGTLAASTAGFAASMPAGGGTATLDSVSVDSAAMIGGAPAHSANVVLSAPLATQLGTPAPTFTQVSIAADQTVIAPNGAVVLTVRATEAGTGAPVVNTRIRIAVAEGLQWKSTTELTTDAQGNAKITTRLLSTTTLTAAFDGTNALRPSLAGATTVTVKSPDTMLSRLSQGPVTASEVPGNSYGVKAVYLASLQKGKPYVYGAVGPYSFDCSGLVQYIYRQLGRSLPRTAQQQYNATTRVPQSGKQPGDLIFFGSPSNITHVGIYAGNGYMWNAPQTGQTVALVPIWTSSYYVGRVY